MIKPHFTDIEKVIIESINSARKEIRIAVAWFNNSNIYNSLTAKLPHISLTLLLSNDKNNYDNGLDFSKIIQTGGKVFLYSKNKLMHNKYLIVDSNTLITGSYNFTFGAEYLNEENIILFKDEESITEHFIDNFNTLLASAKEVSDFNSEINKTDDSVKNIFEQNILIEEFKVDPKIELDEIEKVAHAIIEQYNLGHLETRGRAILSLVEDKLKITDNQKFLMAAYITLISTGENAFAERCLKKIRHHDIEKFKQTIQLLIQYKVNLTLA
jgi:hypothetical protein